MSQPPRDSNVFALRARSLEDRAATGMASASLGGGGGGPFGGLEARVAKLEASVGHIEKDVAELRSDFKEFRRDINGLSNSAASLKEKVDHLPGKGFIVTAVVGALGLLAALIVFADQIRDLFP